MITPHILIISAFLSITWGIYLAYTITDYWRAKAHQVGVIIAFRRLVVALNIWLICFAYVFRTVMILLGFGDAVIGQITFFAILGTNVVGSLFAVVSLRYD